MQIKVGIVLHSTMTLHGFHLQFKDRLAHFSIRVFLWNRITNQCKFGLHIRITLIWTGGLMSDGDQRIVTVYLLFLYRQPSRNIELRSLHKLGMHNQSILLQGDVFLHLLTIFEVSLSNYRMILLSYLWEPCRDGDNHRFGDINRAGLVAGCMLLRSWVDLSIFVPWEVMLIVIVVWGAVIKVRRPDALSLVRFGLPCLSGSGSQDSKHQIGLVTPEQGVLVLVEVFMLKLGLAESIHI